MIKRILPITMLFLLTGAGCTGNISNNQTTSTIDSEAKCSMQAQELSTNNSNNSVIKPGLITGHYNKTLNKCFIHEMDVLEGDYGGKLDMLYDVFDHTQYASMFYDKDPITQKISVSSCYIKYPIQISCSTEKDYVDYANEYLEGSLQF